MELPEGMVVPAIVDRPSVGREAVDIVIHATRTPAGIRVYIGEAENASHSLWLAAETLPAVTAALVDITGQLSS